MRYARTFRGLHPDQSCVSSTARGAVVLGAVGVGEPTSRPRWVISRCAVASPRSCPPPMQCSSGCRHLAWAAAAEAETAAARASPSPHHRRSLLCNPSMPRPPQISRTGRRSTTTQRHHRDLNRLSPMTRAPLNPPLTGSPPPPTAKLVAFQRAANGNATPSQSTARRQSLSSPLSQTGGPYPMAKRRSHHPGE